MKNKKDILKKDNYCKFVEWFFDDAIRKLFHKSHRKIIVDWIREPNQMFDVIADYYNFNTEQFQSELIREFHITELSDIESRFRPIPVKPDGTFLDEKYKLLFEYERKNDTRRIN